MNLAELAKDYLPAATIVKIAAKKEQNPDERARFSRWLNQSNIIVAIQIVRQMEALETHIKALVEPAKGDETGIEWTRIKKQMHGEEGKRVASEFLKINEQFKLFGDAIERMMKSPETREVALALAERFVSSAGSVAAQRTVVTALAGATGGIALAAVTAYMIFSKAKSLYEKAKAPLEERFDAEKQRTLSA